MFGAREVKSVSRFAQEHAGEWRPIHSAILGCLLAHRNSQSRRCDPSRVLMAKHCNVHERTIDRAVAELRAWGAIATSKPKLVDGTFARTQYTLLFEAPCDTALSLSPCDNGDAAMRQKGGSPCDKNGGHHATNPCDKAVSTKALESGSSIEAQEEGGITEAAEPKPKPPNNLIPYEHATHEQRMMRGSAMAAWSRGEITYEQLQQAIAKSGCGPLAGVTLPRGPARAKFSQNDFDERDLRKLQAELEKIYRSLDGARIVGSEYEREQGEGTHSHEKIFTQACARAGIPVGRGLELSDGDWKKKNPGRQTFDEAEEKPRTG